MKSVTAIFFLSVLAFNCVGYHFISSIAENQSDAKIEATIDQSGYDISALVELRVPMNTPYLTERSGEFEKFGGEISIGNVDYKYVMRKVDGNELVLLCLPNQEKSRIKNSRVEFFKLVNDLNNTSHGKEKQNPSAFKSFTAVYRADNNSWALRPLDEQPEKDFFPAGNCVRLTGFGDIVKQPPRA